MNEPVNDYGKRLDVGFRMIHGERVDLYEEEEDVEYDEDEVRTDRLGCDG